MKNDPALTDPGLYRVVMENERVRVLEYRDAPGDRTSPHAHPDSVMIAASAFRRKLIGADREVEVEIGAGTVRWLDAQEHAGANIGETESHAFFIELKEPRPTPEAGSASERLGPSRH
jgi:beta-alanine degradation protein BauB